MKKDSPLKIVCIFLIAAWFAAACSSSVDKDRRNVEETIKRYDSLLSEGYLKMSMEGLNEVSTANHMSRLSHRIEGLIQNKRRLEAKLTKIEFTDFQFLKTGSAFVTTREVWDIRHVDSESGETVKEISGFAYVLKYTLRLQEARWFIDSVEVIEEKSSAQSRK